MTRRAIIASLATTKHSNPKNYHKIQINPQIQSRTTPKNSNKTHTTQINPQQTTYHLALNPAQPEANSTQRKPNPRNSKTHITQIQLKPRSTQKPKKLTRLQIQTTHKSPKIQSTQPKENSTAQIPHNLKFNQPPHKSPKKIPKSYISSPSYRHSS